MAPGRQAARQGRTDLPLAAVPRALARARTEADWRTDIRLRTTLAHQATATLARLATTVPAVSIHCSTGALSPTGARPSVIDMVGDHPTRPTEIVAAKSDRSDRKLGATEVAEMAEMADMVEMAQASLWPEGQLSQSPRQKQ